MLFIPSFLSANKLLIIMFFPQAEVIPYFLSANKLVIIMFFPQAEVIPYFLSANMLVIIMFLLLRLKLFTAFYLLM
jgi:hypothetical protein